MEVLLRIVLGGLVAAHGLVHLLYFVANVDDPKWPFTLSRSWLLPETARRPLGATLIAVTITAFSLLGLAVWGVPGLSAHWPSLAIIGSLASLVTLVAFWNTQLMVGVAIDVALIIIAIARPDWTHSVS